VSSQGGFESDEWYQAAPIRQPGRERLVKAESQFVFSVVADEWQIANLVDGLSDAELAIAPIVEQLTGT
jgi:hypothetical protein